MIRVAVGVDPGLRACGVAIAHLQTSALHRAWLAKSPEKEDDGAKAWEAMALTVSRQLVSALQELATESQARVRLELLVVERQAIRGSPSRGLITKNPGAMLGLTAVAGAILVLVPAADKLSLYPQQWNGNKKKDESTATVWRALDAEERRRALGAELKSNGHNVIDAIGIAKWASRRAWQQHLFAERK